MCGIVGYVGEKNAKDVIIAGLKKLEYRGYDSCGVVTMLDNRFDVTKSTKRIDDLEEQIKNNKFEVSSHQKKLDVATDSNKKIYEEAKKLLHEIYKGIPIRLIGIRVDNLCMKDEVQLSLFDVEVDEKQIGGNRSKITGNKNDGIRAAEPERQ